MHKKVLVFSDLDGTLLDHHTYSFSAAVPTLNKLSACNIPVIPTTSKTYAELKQIRNDIGLDGPFIIENGAAVYIPIHFFDEQPEGTIVKNGFWIKEFSKPVSHWLTILKQLKSEFAEQFTHFSNMTNADIRDATGLAAEQAKLAGSREYGEPILWLADEPSKARFIQALEKLGATPLQGGRFLHLSGECDKGKALLWLKQVFQLNDPTNQVASIALGDGQNDVAMLNAADISIRILSPVNEPPKLNKENNVYTSTLYGPEGWTECLQAVLFDSKLLDI